MTKSEIPRDTEKVRQIKPAEPSCFGSPRGRTPLIVAIEHGYKDFVRILIDAKANVNMIVRSMGELASQGLDCIGLRHECANSDTKGLDCK